MQSLQIHIFMSFYKVNLTAAEYGEFGHSVLRAAVHLFGTGGGGFLPPLGSIALGTSQVVMLSLLCVP